MPNMSSFTTSMMPVYVALIALVGVALGAFLTARFGFQSQIRLATHQSRKQAYAAIMGKKFLLTQLYVSRFEALIYSDFHEYLWHLSGNSTVSLDLEEAKRWMHKSEELAIEVARTNQSLFESVGMAQASFSSSEELESVSDRIYRFKTPTIAPPPPGSDRTLLEAWKVKAVTQLQELTQREYSEPIDSLLMYLKQHMNDRVST